MDKVKLFIHFCELFHIRSCNDLPRARYDVVFLPQAHAGNLPKAPMSLTCLAI